MPLTARTYHTQQIHFIRGTVAFNTTGAAAGVVIGRLPAGARVLRTNTIVETAFNAATTNTLDTGVTGAQTSLVAAGAAGAVGSTQTVPAGAGGVVSADIDVLVRYNSTGAAATAGSATVVVEYVPNI